MVTIFIIQQNHWTACPDVAEVAVFFLLHQLPQWILLGSCRPSGGKAAAFWKCLDLVALLLLSGNRNCWVKMGCFFLWRPKLETFSWNKHCMTFIGLTRPAFFLLFARQSTLKMYAKVFSVSIEIWNIYTHSNTCSTGIPVKDVSVLSQKTSNSKHHQLLIWQVFIGLMPPFSKDIQYIYIYTYVSNKI